MSGPLHKLTYYNMPGKAEPIRLALHIAGINWEDNFVDGAAWQPIKAGLLSTVPLANLPLLEVNGQHFTEAKAILRYVGTIGNLVPSDPLGQLKVDQVLSLSEDIFTSFIGVVFASYASDEEKLAAHAALFVPEGKVYKCLEKFEKFVASLQGEFVCGEQLTVADLMLFCNFGLLICGLFDGFDVKIFESFEAIQAFRHKVGTHPKVRSRYANITEGFISGPGFKF